MVIGGYGPEGSSGHSGSETSKERADRDDASGITSKRDRETLVRLHLANTMGYTCAEFERKFDLSHGQASGSLSRLHRAGLITRLRNKRDGQQVYVHRAHVSHGDDLAPYRPNAAYREDRRPMALELPNDTQIAQAMERCGWNESAGLTVSEVRYFLEELKEVVENGG